MLPFGSHQTPPPLYRGSRRISSIRCGGQRHVGTRRRIQVLAAKARRVSQLRSLSWTPLCWWFGSHTCSPWRGVVEGSQQCCWTPRRCSLGLGTQAHCATDLAQPWPGLLVVPLPWPPTDAMGPRPQPQISRVSFPRCVVPSPAALGGLS
jgi:hypothetical protein